MDDDLAVRDSLGLILELGGFRVSRYASGAAFLEADTIDQFDCLVVDMHMPHMDGIDLIRRIRATNPHIPVVLISGNLDTAIRTQGGAVGIKHFLKKPFSGMDLLDLLRSIAD